MSADIDIDIHPHYVEVNGVKIPRKRMSPLQWLEFWEAFTDDSYDPIEMYQKGFQDGHAGVRARY